MTIIICFLCGLSVERYENGNGDIVDEIITGELFETIGRILETETDENVIVCASSLRVYTDYHVVFFKRGDNYANQLQQTLRRTAPGNV